MWQASQRPGPRQRDLHSLLVEGKRAHAGLEQASLVEADTAMSSHWDGALGVAVQHDKARARAAELREEADRLDARADELEQRFVQLMNEAAARMNRGDQQQTGAIC